MDVVLWRELAEELCSTALPRVVGQAVFPGPGRRRGLRHILTRGYHFRRQLRRERGRRLVRLTASWEGLRELRSCSATAACPTSLRSAPERDYPVRFLGGAHGGEFALRLCWRVS